MGRPSPDQLPIRRALIWIALSVLIFAGATLGLGLSINFYKNLRAENPRYTLKKIVPKAHRDLYIPEENFAKWLEIFTEHPPNLYHLNHSKMLTALLRQPILEKIRLTKQPPGSLIIDYWPRMPIFQLLDQKSTLLDDQAIVIPHDLWITGNYPEVFFGLSEPIAIGERITGPKWDTVKEVLTAWQQKNLPYQLSRIDVSQSFAKSAGKRQVVLVIDLEGEATHYLRLPYKGFDERLRDYATLCQHWEEIDEIYQDRVVDFRIEEIALIKGVQ